MSTTLEKDDGPAVTQNPINSDSESGLHHRDTTAGEVDLVPANNREPDFFTRNGLNLRSFQRRESFLPSLPAFPPTSFSTLPCLIHPTNTSPPRTTYILYVPPPHILS